MVDFEKLQELWRNQPHRAEIDEASLTQAVARYGRRQRWINLIKIAIVLPILGLAAAYMRHSPLAVAGLAVICAGAMIFLLLDWRSQRAISRMNFAAPSAGFIRGAIDRLMEQKEPFHKRYWPFLLVMIGGMNLVLLGTMAAASRGQRILWHLIDSALPFGAYELGRRVRVKRFASECMPLVERLTAIKRALEERSL